MTAILQIGKRHWLVGMQWITYESAPNKDVLRDEIEWLSKRKNGIFSPNYIAARIDGACTQSGFAQLSDEEKPPKKLYSLAAMLAEFRKQPWLGIFKLDEDLFWLIAVSDGNGILPDGDVIGNRTEIEAIRHRHIKQDEDWECVDGTFDLLEEILESIDKKPILVRPLSADSFPWKSVCAAGLLICLVSSGVWQFYEMKEARIRQAKEKISKEARENQASIQIAQTDEHLLAEIPKPSVWLQACKDIVYELPLTQHGWALSSLNCTQKEAFVVWKREAGATVEIRPEGLLDELGETVNQTIPLAFPSFSHKEHLLSIQQGITALLAWSQRKDITIKIDSPNARSTGAIPGADVHPIEMANKSEREIYFNIISPFSFADEFDAIPGFRITSISPNLNSLSQASWHVHGRLYGR